MGSMTASVGSWERDGQVESAAESRIRRSILMLDRWLEDNDYRGYDTFDGLNARFVRPLTFETKLLRTVLQQGIRRFPLNLRPLLGVTRERSTKGMGFLARGYMRMHEATGEKRWADKAEFALDWLIDHISPGYSGACWGNHFDYQSRAFYLPRNVPTVVWTSLIGHAFLDGFEQFRNEKYLEVAVSACRHIVKDLARNQHGEGICFSYVPGQTSEVHNANTLGGSLLARVSFFARNEEYRQLSTRALRYTAQHQRPDGSWYYGEKENLHWVDSFHTAYVLDCFKHFGESTGDRSFDEIMMKGYEYWKRTFFLEDGLPRYYANKTLPIDIQCSSQAIDTFVFFSDRDPEAADLALKVADWTIKHMQDESGYFYYRRYAPMLVNKTATLHWGQATMLCALAGLYRSM
jgi:rhamnogalacturonyl hydrolase YesR